MTLIYSPCQVSKHHQETHQTVDWEICFLLGQIFWTTDQLPELLVEVTFKHRAFQTDVPFNETFKSVLRVLKLDQVHSKYLPRLNVTVVMKDCPGQCMETVAVEVLHWRNMLQRSGGWPEPYRCFHLKVPGRLIMKLTPSQLYQTSIPNCIRLANSKPFPISINMFYRLEGSHLMSKTFLFDSVRKQLLGEVNLDFCCHHKKSSLDLSLLQRNL